MTTDESDMTPYTEDDIMLAEYVGYPLYVTIRKRLLSLGSPLEMVNPVIREAIEVHDLGELLGTPPGATIIVDQSDDMHIKCWVEEGLVGAGEIDLTD